MKRVLIIAYMNFTGLLFMIAVLDVILTSTPFSDFYLAYHWYASMVFVIWAGITAIIITRWLLHHIHID